MVEEYGRTRLSSKVLIHSDGDLWLGARLQIRGLSQSAFEQENRGAGEQELDLLRARLRWPRQSLAQAPDRFWALKRSILSALRPAPQSARPTHRSRRRRSACRPWQGAEQAPRFGSSLLEPFLADCGMPLSGRRSRFWPASESIRRVPCLPISGTRARGSPGGEQDEIVEHAAHGTLSCAPCPRNTSHAGGPTTA